MKLFVYGTLRKGLHNNHYLKEAKFVGLAFACDFTIAVNALPYLIQKKGSKAIGEVYEISEHTLASIDELEGHPHWYIRELINVHLETKTFQVFSYVMKEIAGEYQEVEDYYGFCTAP